MNLKIAFGIILPVIIVIVLSILGSLDIGFSVSKSFIKEISLGQVYSNGQLSKSIVLGNITLKNDYFLGKRYDLMPLYGCLIDKEGQKEKRNAGSIFFNEGDYDPANSADILSYGYSNNQERSVEVDPNAEKNVNIYLSPSYDYYYGNNYSQLLEQYQDYDELIVLERTKSDNTYYNLYGYNQNKDCYNLQDSDIEEAQHIKLILK